MPDFGRICRHFWHLKAHLVAKKLTEKFVKDWIKLLNFHQFSVHVSGNRLIVDKLRALRKKLRQD
jgi:hypothetical protein